MTVDYDTIKDTIAQSIASAVASASSDAMSSLDVSAIGITATWDGSNVVTCSDTTGIVAGGYARVNSVGTWFKVASVTLNTSFTVEDTYSAGFPSGGTATALSATLTWDGSQTVLASSTSEVDVGDSIRLGSSGDWFFVAVVTAGVSFTILPGGKTIPSGSGTSWKAGSSYTATKLPEPPSGGSLEDKIGYPIANPVVDDGIKFVQQQPHELPNYTVAQANALPGPATGSMIFVTNEAGGSVPAFYDGSNWRRVQDRGVIS